MRHSELFRVKSTVLWLAAHKDTVPGPGVSHKSLFLEAHTLWFNSCQSAQYKFKNDQRTQASWTVNDANNTRDDNWSLFSTVGTVDSPFFDFWHGCWRMRIYRIQKIHISFLMGFLPSLFFRLAFSWPTCPTMVTIGWVCTHLSIWLPFFTHGQTWNSTLCHLCNLLTSTSSFFLNKETPSGRCVCMGIYPNLSILVYLLCYCEDSPPVRGAPSLQTQNI